MNSNGRPSLTRMSFKRRQPSSSGESAKASKIQAIRLNITNHPKPGRIIIYFSATFLVGFGMFSGMVKPGTCLPRLPHRSSYQAIRCHPGSFQQFIGTGGIIKVSDLVLTAGKRWKLYAKGQNEKSGEL